MVERKPGQGCKGCFYRKKLANNGPVVCQYSIFNDRLRGCPAGAECIHYKAKNFVVKGGKKTTGGKDNCVNCGAPIDRDLMQCPYCGTFYEEAEDE